VGLDLDRLPEAECDNGVAGGNRCGDEDSKERGPKAVDERADGDRDPHRVQQDLGVGEAGERRHRQEVDRGVDDPSSQDGIEAERASRAKWSTDRAHDHS
jgi:hypothetical protein